MILRVKISNLYVKSYYEDMVGKQIKIPTTGGNSNQKDKGDQERSGKKNLHTVAIENGIEVNIGRLKKGKRKKPNVPTINYGTIDFFSFYVVWYLL